MVYGFLHWYTPFETELPVLARQFCTITLGGLAVFAITSLWPHSLVSPAFAGVAFFNDRYE
jgi:hypothetical protein